jgi:hypothetical protein
VNRRIARWGLALTGAAVLATALATTPAVAHDRAGDNAAKAETFLAGTVVDKDTGNPVSDIRVTLRDVVTHDVLAADHTNASGRYRMEDLHEDEYGIWFAGRPKAHESGYLGCGHGVVPTWGEACSFGTGRVGVARLERL